MLKDTLLVPSLTTKLISVGRLAEDLNCVVLMYPNFCIFQDILTKEILGRSIKRNGLYHLEDLSTGSTCLVERSTQRNNIVLWHKRLGHPSVGYMRRIFPSLWDGVSNFELKCETCIKSKSHRNTYPSTYFKSLEFGDLVHSDM